jgi:hypothetical protein
MPLSDKDILGLNRAFPMPVADPTERRGLQTKGAVTEMQQLGADRRKAATVAGALRQAALLDNRVLAPEEIQPGAKFSTATIEDAILRQGLANALKGAKSADYARSAGIAPKQVAGPEGKLVDPTFKLGGIAGLDFISGGPTKGQSAAKAAAEVQAKQSQQQTRERIKIGDTFVGAEKVKDVVGVEQTGKIKNTPEALAAAKRIIARAKAQFPGQDVQGPFDIGGGKSIITVDGDRFDVNIVP